MDHLQERLVSFRDIRCRIKYSAQAAREDVGMSVLMSSVPTSPDTSWGFGNVTMKLSMLSLCIHEGG